MIRKMLLAATVVAGSSGVALAAPLFFDDFNADAQGLGLTFLTNWTATPGDVDVIGTGSFDFYPGNGNYIDLNGYNNATLTTNSALSFVLGQTYEISFNFGYNMGSGPSNEQLSFGLGSTTLGTLNSAILATANPNFGTWTYIFTASSSFSATLFFADLNATPDDNGGPVIDNVSVAAVPLPAGAPLLLAGLAGLGLLKRRRKA